MNLKNYFRLLRNAAVLIAATLFGINQSNAATKTAILSGDWSSSLIWSPLGVPQFSDDVIIITTATVTISSNQSIQSVTVNAGATLTWSNSSTLTINGNLAVSGLVKMNGGNITETNSNAIFSITNSGTFEWQPGNNTAAGASLLTNSSEYFSMFSTLKIKQWYDYNIPLGSVVSGNFGNVQMSSKTGNNSYVEWNQNNQFQTHQIFGTLSIIDGWVTLDRSGSISNTTIGSISLLNANSTFIAHRGNHPSSFTLNTNSISNVGGEFNGILDGNGNITLFVDGDVTTSGDFKVINNDGVPNTSNGNATFTVTGTFYQTDGDSRIIYNIATTNSGIFNATLGNIEFDGGIFMGQYACHATAQTCSLTVNNNINCSFSHGNEKFRGLGLTSLSGNNNTAQFYFYVGGNVTINSTSNGAEFTTSAGTGFESDLINGTFSLSGGQTSIDYGTGQASHNSVLTVNVNMIVQNGTMNLSRLNGTTDIYVGGNVSVSNNGTLSVKGGTGTANMTVMGNFTQTGGSFNLHANNAVVSMSPVTLTVYGDFTQTNGTINFDANGSTVSAEDQIIIKGANFNLSGTGAAVMTQAGAGTNPIFGFLRFMRQGTTTFNRSNAYHNLAQIKIVIDSGTTVNVSGGNMQIASHTNPGTDYLTVKSGGTLNLNGYQVYSNATYANSGMRVEDGGTLSTKNLWGLYDGSTSAAIKSSGNMNFYLGAASTIEYSGLTNQIVTGIGQGVATTDNQKYGILRVDFKGMNNVNYVYPTSSNVYTRTQLQLTNGELFLNGYTLTLENGSSQAITRTNGYVKSESQYATNNGCIKWKNVSSGTYVFPFGKKSYYYLPVIFTPAGRASGDVTIRTRATGQDNLPLPVDPLNLSAVAAPVDPNNNLIDRWWDISAPGLTADVTLTYASDENTMATLLRNGSLNIEQFNNGSWNRVPNAGTGVIIGTGTATVQATSLFSSWTISTQTSAPLPIQLIGFTATPQNASVLLSWTTAMEVNNDYFTIEKSRDGSTFTYLAHIKGAGNSNRPIHYKHNDNELTDGVTYYRLQQTDFDGKSTYSRIVSVNLGNIYNVSEIAFTNIFPSPFQNEFTVQFNSSKEQNVNVKVTDMSGKIIASDRIGSTTGANSYHYSGSDNLPGGIYLINLSTPSKSITQRIVKK